MPNRDLNVNIDGDPKGLQKAFDAAERRLKKFEKELERAEKQRDAALSKLADVTKATAPIEETGRSLSNMFGMIGKVGPANVALAAGAIEMLPTIASLAASGVVLSLGAALAGIGIQAAAGSDRVQAEWSDLGSELKGELADAAAPLEDSLLHAADVAEGVFDGIKDDLHDAFEGMAPGVDRLVDGLGQGVEGIQDMLEPLGDAFGTLLGNVGDRIPEIFENVEDTVMTFVEIMNEDPTMLADLLEDGTELLSVGAEILAWADEIKAALTLPVNPKNSSDLLFEQMFGATPEQLMKDVEEMPATMSNLRDKIDAAARAAVELGTGAGTAEGGIRDLSRALEDFFDPAAKALDAEIRLKEAIQNADEAAKEQNLTGIDRLKAVQDLTTALADAAKNESEVTGGTKKATEAFQRNLDKLVEWSGKNQAAQGAVDGLAKSLGITIIRTKDGTVAIDKMGRAIQILPNGKRVEIDTNTAKGKKQLAEFLLYIARQKGTIDVRVRTIYDNKSGQEAIASKVKAMGGIERYEAGGIRSIPPMVATSPTILFGEGAGDEAFIPYEMRFRSRAKDLVRQVASDFGMLRPGPAAIGRAGNTTITVTNYYPVAEAASTTTNRVLQYASSLGVV